MIRMPKGTGRRILTPQETSAFAHDADAYPMPSEVMGMPPVAERLYHGYEAIDVVPPELYEKYDVKRGLRNADGSGVLVGLTTISNVHGYNKTEHGVEPDEGDLIYRGIPVGQLIDGSQAEGRFGYEEVAYLLITGSLPTKEELADFQARIDSRRQLPEGYLGIFPRTTFNHSIMNVLQRATLLLYAFDPNGDDTSPTHEIDVAISLLGRWPRAAAVAHAAKVAADNDKRLVVPPAREGYSMAETVLDVLRSDEGFTHEEAMLLDVMLMLHAEHGGGNNSTFATRVLSSSATDPYSAYAAAIGSLKGPRHGGANAKVVAMHKDIREHVARWEDDDEVAAYLAKLLRREAFDGSGLIYGMGHAVYTLSDPRAVICKEHARAIAEAKGVGEEFALIERVERLAPQVMRDVRGTTKPICANIDLYTGFIYGMLGVPETLFTPLFAVARTAGWAAHRMEELFCAHRIIRPAYRSVTERQEYVPLEERGDGEEFAPDAD